jgi:hypothetical protein
MREEEPLLFIDVKIGENPENIKRIEIFRNDNPADIAREFSELHQLNSEKTYHLEHMLRLRLYEFYSQVDSKSDI